MLTSRTEPGVLDHVSRCFLIELGVPREGVDASRARLVAVLITVVRSNPEVVQIDLSSVKVISFVAKLFATVPSFNFESVVEDAPPVPKTRSEEESETALFPDVELESNWASAFWPGFPLPLLEAIAEIRVLVRRSAVPVSVSEGFQPLAYA